MKMMKLSVKLCVLGSFVLTAPLAWADILYVNKVPKYIYQGAFVGPAGASWESKAAGWEFGVVCDDIRSVTYVPSSFPVVVSSFPDLADRRFTNVDIETYQRAAWLYDQIYANIGNATTVGQIQFAIWELFYQGTPNNYGDWYTRAMQVDLTGYDFSAFRILTPVEPALSNQEFITKVPEPFELITLLVGVFAVVVFRKRWCNATE